MGLKTKIISTTALALTANMAFVDTADVADISNVNWNIVIKNPVMFQEPPTGPMNIGDRQLISAVDARFNGAGRILYNGNNHCSGNIVEIEGYHPIIDGILVSTAAHCLDQGVQPQNITFAISFLDDDGTLNYQHYANPLTWYNPSFVENNLDTDAANDQALMFFPNAVLPREVVPSELQIFSEHIMRDFGVYEWHNTSVIAAGYSSDLVGLSVDEDCRIRELRQADVSYLHTDCSLTYGASGSGLITEDHDDRLRIGAITSSISRGTAPTDAAFSSYFTLMYHQNLAAIPFLEKEEVCARVTAPSGLFVRTEDYNSPESAYASLAFNQVVFVTDMLEDAQEIYGAEDVWLQIRTLDNPDAQTPNGYSNSAWLTPTPCPSR